MEGSVVIFAESRDGKLRNVSFEAASTGRKLADEFKRITDKLVEKTKERGDN